MVQFLKSLFVVSTVAAVAFAVPNVMRDVSLVTSDLENINSALGGINGTLESFSSSNTVSQTQVLQGQMVDLCSYFETATVDVTSNGPLNDTEANPLFTFLEGNVQPTLYNVAMGFINIKPLIAGNPSFAPVAAVQENIIYAHSNSTAYFGALCANSPVDLAPQCYAAAGAIIALWRFLSLSYNS